MDDQLALLLSLYEDEINQLEKRIEESLADKEYQMAHFHSEALFRIIRKVQTLRAIEDEFSEEKFLIGLTLKYLNAQLDSEISLEGKVLLQESIEEYKARLEKLNGIKPKDKTSNISNSFFEETLKRLLSREIKHLKLVLSKKDNLCLLFNYNKKILRITIPQVKQHLKNQRIAEYQIQLFEKNGFILSLNDSRLVLTLAGNNEEILNRSKIILSKLVFEIFNFKDFENESYVQFTEK